MIEKMACIANEVQFQPYYVQLLCVLLSFRFFVTAPKAKSVKLRDIVLLRLHRP